MIESYRAETALRSKEISHLSNVDQAEVFQVTRCAACQQQLDLPSVHFMCKHSYHQRQVCSVPSCNRKLTNRCLPDADPECPLCSKRHAVIREIRTNQTRLADRHDLFLAEVHDAEDGFAVVTGAFGRGLMEKHAEGDM